MSNYKKRYHGYSCYVYLKGINNNRLNENNWVSLDKKSFDGYSNLSTAYNTKETGYAFEHRGINRRLKYKINRNRSDIDKLRSMTDG